MISNIQVIFKREFSSYLNSPAAYVFVVIFLLMTGFFTFIIGDFIGIGQANLLPFFRWVPWLYLALIPAVGMPLWSDERRMGTVELLFTMPVSMTECILGKFLAAWAFIIIALLLTFPVVITVSYLGNPDYGMIVCGYLGCALLGGAYLSVASMTSAMTRSQVVSFIISVMLCLILIFIGWEPVLGLLAEWAPAWLINAVSGFGIIPHFYGLQRGALDSRDIVYYLSIIAFSLFATGIFLKNHRAG